ncbi:MAG TPA: ferritin-like domain-containing protein [Acidimicrobiales bacterium]|nr:ferritin-like domain-containing protein [Acidimicrobiales bacterium]
MSTTEAARNIDANDVDSIVIERSDVDEVVHTIHEENDVLFTWDYERSRPALVKLYEKAKKSQWNATTDLDWSTEVDNEKLATEFMATIARFDVLHDVSDSPTASWGNKEWEQFAVENQTWTLSQFLHGEQGALICTGLITATVPWIDAKYYAATQVMDEARHVEVFGRYLEEKMGGAYPINPQLKSLLDDIISDGRWDITYLGMQIMVEGLALAAFGFLHMLTQEPLLKKLLRYVMGDEARHVAFGVISLQELYNQLSASEIKERQEFAFEAAVRLRNRFFAQDVWEKLGVDPKEIVRFLQTHPDPMEEMFQTMLFSKIVPNVKKLGLLDAGDGWLRERFTELGIIQFENNVDTSEEYDSLDAVAAAAKGSGLSALG